MSAEPEGDFVSRASSKEAAGQSHRMTCERFVDGGGACGDPATLAVKIKPGWPHSPNCARKGKCLGHPICERCAADLRTKDVVARIKDYPIRPPRLEPSHA